MLKSLVALWSVRGLVASAVFAVALLGQLCPRSVTPDPGGRIVFTSTRDDPNGDIYSMAGDGSNIRRLTNHPDVDRSPAMSLRSNKIVFASYRDRSSVGSHVASHLFIMDSADLVPRRLTGNTDVFEIAPRFTPDGNSVVFLVTYPTPRGEIRIIGTDGTNQRTLVSGAGEFDLSPDGRLLVYYDVLAETGGLSILELGGSNAARRISESGCNPSFSPDGQQVVFLSPCNFSGDFHLMDLRNGSVRRLTNDPSGKFDLDFHPRMNLIMFTYNGEGNSEIYTLGLDNSRLVNVTRAPSSAENEAKWAK